jgi:hypothetical protein
MAVAAADIAFRDLPRDRCESESVAHKPHHAIALVRPGSMVEVQDTDVVITAVDARVLPQVFADERPGRGPLCVVARADDTDVMLAIALIVVSRRLAITVSAHFLQPVRSGRFPVEI